MSQFCIIQRIVVPRALQDPRLRKGYLAGLSRALLCLLATASAGCSLKTYAINMVGDALASGNSVYETDEDIDLVGQALPFGLKLTESLLEQSPNHHGLLLTACRGFVLYSYAYVQYESEVTSEDDLDRGGALRNRARRLYQRGLRYCFRSFEQSYPNLEAGLLKDPKAAVAPIGARNKTRDVELLYWTAAALGLAISASPDDPAMLARLPEVEAMLDRALVLDERWDGGALHEFKVIFAGARPGAPADVALIRRHYERALELSKGMSAGLYIAYAEAVALPAQNKAEFRALLEKALAVDPDLVPRDRLANLVSQRRARWLLDRTDDLILDDNPGGKP
jgi:predicted anti-sigma-YlaC factor YlaD